MKFLLVGILFVCSCRDQILIPTDSQFDRSDEAAIILADELEKRWLLPKEIVLDRWRERAISVSPGIVGGPSDGGIIDQHLHVVYHWFQHIIFLDPHRCFGEESLIHALTHAVQCPIIDLRNEHEGMSPPNCDWKHENKDYWWAAQAAAKKWASIFGSCSL